MIDDSYVHSDPSTVECRETNFENPVGNMLEERDTNGNQNFDTQFENTDQCNYDCGLNVSYSMKPSFAISELEEVPEWGERMKASLKTRKPRRSPVGGKWSKEEDEKLLKLVEIHGPKNWKMISQLLGNVRDKVQCLHRYNKVLKPGLQKGPWTEEEDAILLNVVLKYDDPNRVKWSEIAIHLNGRIGKQCRERWNNHVNPAIRKGKWTLKEDELLFEAQTVFGNRWTEIAKLLPGRTENNVKNRFHSASARKNWSQPISKRIIRNPDPIRIAELYKMSEELFGNFDNDTIFQKQSMSDENLFRSNKKLRCAPFHDQLCDGDTFTQSFSYNISATSVLEPPAPIDTSLQEVKLQRRSSASIDAFDTSILTPNSSAGFLSGMTPSGFLDWLVDSSDLCDREVPSLPTPSNTIYCDYKPV